MKTRFLAMLLAVLMIAGAAMTVSAFEDVPAGSDHANAINVLNQLGVIDGYEDGTFKPDQKVTRAEMARLVYSLYTTFKTAGAGTDTFDDVKADNWAAGFITWCVAKEVIHGYGNGKFGPTDNVTYDAALKMVCSVLGYTDWDSALWPTNVRVKALRELNLGEGLEDVKGEAELTRGQVAQILYNALDEEMNETKTVNQTANIGGVDIDIPKTVAKTLQADVWFVEEVADVITGATEVDNEEALVLGTLGTKTLEELGLVAYEGKTADLKDLSITLLKNTKKDEIIDGSAVIAGSVVDGVKVTMNGKTAGKNTITIAGVTYNKDSKVEDIPVLYTYAGGEGAKVIVNGNIDASIKNDDVARLYRAIDKDGDGDVDYLVVAEKAVYTAGKTKVVDKVEVLPYYTLAGSKVEEIATAKVSAKLAEEDVFVAAKLGQTLYVEVIKPVEAYATKLTAEKVTLNGVGEVKYASSKINGAVLPALDAEDLGEDNKAVFYIYNGEIVYFTGVKAAAAAYDIAILKEIVEVEGEGYNESTMQQNDKTYVATLIVDGKEVKLTLANDDAVVGAATLDAADAYTTYKRTTDSTDGNRVIFNYTLVAAYEKTEAGYVLTINKDLDKVGEDKYTVVPAGATLTYNATTGLYTIADVKKVVLDAKSEIFYTYTLETTGNYKYLGSYNKDTLTEKNFTATTADVAYLINNEDGTKTLIATIVTDEIKGSADEVKSYLNDGRLVLYAPEASAVVVDGNKKYLEYVFMDNATITNAAPVVDKTLEAADATATEAGYFYGFNGTKYVKVNAASGLDVIKAATLSTVLADRDLLGYTVAGAEDFIKVADDVTIWGLAEEDKLDKYVQLSLEELGEMLELVTEAEAGDIDLLLVYYKNADGDLVLASIIFEYYVEVEENVVSVNDTIFDNYNA